MSPYDAQPTSTIASERIVIVFAMIRSHFVGYSFIEAALILLVARIEYGDRSSFPAFRPRRLSIRLVAAARLAVAGADPDVERADDRLVRIAVARQPDVPLPVPQRGAPLLRRAERLRPGAAVLGDADRLRLADRRVLRCGPARRQNDGRDRGTERATRAVLRCRDVFLPRRATREDTSNAAGC